MYVVHTVRGSGPFAISTFQFLSLLSDLHFSCGRLRLEVVSVFHQTQTCCCASTINTKTNAEKIKLEARCNAEQSMFNSSSEMYVCSYLLNSLSSATWQTLLVGMTHIPCVHSTNQMPKPYRPHEVAQPYSNIIQVPILSQYPRILASLSVPAHYSKYV